MEVVLRLLGKQDLPRVVATPQALITKDNVESFAVKGEELRKVLLAQPAG
jgi:ribose transport system substrate-binding protein